MDETLHDVSPKEKDNEIEISNIFNENGKTLQELMREILSKIVLK